MAFAGEERVVSLDGEQLAEIADLLRFEGERFPVQVQGETVGVLAPLSDLRALEALEDLLDLLDSLDALEDYRKNGGVDFESIKADLGL